MIGGYRYQTSQDSSNNQGKCGILLTSPVDTVGVHVRVGYRSQTIHYCSQRGDSMGDGEIHGIGSEEINHPSLFNVVESVDGNGRIGSGSHTCPSTSHHSGDIGISSGFYSYCDNRRGNRYHTSQFSAYHHGGINISYPRFPQ